MQSSNIVSINLKTEGQNLCVKESLYTYRHGLSWTFIASVYIFRYEKKCGAHYLTVVFKS